MVELRRRESRTESLLKQELEGDKKEKTVTSERRSNEIQGYKFATIQKIPGLNLHCVHSRLWRSS
eukprot:6480834-Amphidinium_carterae.2